MMNKHISDLIFIKWLIGVIFFFLFIYTENIQAEGQSTCHDGGI